jgi:hypothetical protein
MPLGSREYLDTKCFHPSLGEQQHDRAWHAVFTLPQNEKSVVKHLEVREIESFLPTYETIRLWKNRQRKTIILPLFPTYLFVRISSQERTKVLQSTGLLAIVGKNREPRTENRARSQTPKSSFFALTFADTAWSHFTSS